MEDPVIIKLLNEVLSANILYAAEFGDKKNLAIPPERHIAILIWMDARLIPDKFAGLSEGGFIDWLTITDQKSASSKA
jgi:hypothetical protein